MSEVDKALGDSSLLCDALQTLWTDFTSLLITDVSVGDVEATKILQTCLRAFESRRILTEVM